MGAPDEIKGGTLYPVLSRLEEQGLTRTWWVEGAGGPGRKLIAITPMGESELAARTAHWLAWSERVEHLLNDPTAVSGSVGTPTANDLTLNR